MVVIVIGNLSVGIQTIHGPFENFEQANNWISRFAQPSQPCIILPLGKPDQA